MAFDKLYVVNRMMMVIGEKKLSSLGVDSKSQRLANDAFDGWVMEVFSLDIDYKFATARAELSQHSATPISGYDYMYTLPVDCVRVMNVIDENRDIIEYKHRLEMYISGSTQDRVLLCNQDTCFIKYIAFITNPVRWPAWFTKMVILTGALDLVTPVAADEYRALRIQRRLEQAIKDARRANGQWDSDVDENNINLDLGNNGVVEAEFPRRRYYDTDHGW